MPICFPGAAKKILNYDDFVEVGLEFKICNVLLLKHRRMIIDKLWTSGFRACLHHDGKVHAQQAAKFVFLTSSNLLAIKSIPSFNLAHYLDWHIFGEYNHFISMTEN